MTFLNKIITIRMYNRNSNSCRELDHLPYQLKNDSQKKSQRIVNECCYRCMYYINLYFQFSMYQFKINIIF